MSLVLNRHGQAVDSSSQFYENDQGNWVANPTFGVSPMGFTPPAGAMDINGDFWGGVVGGIKGAVGGFIGGGVAGAVGGAVKGAVTGSKGGPSAPPGGGAMLPPGPGWGGGGPGTMGIGGTLGKGVVGAIGGAIGRGVARTPRYVKEIVGGVLGYWVLDKALGWIFKAGHPPKPRMNVLNPRALARADRRIQGFACKVRPVMKSLGYEVSSSRKPKGRSCRPGKKCK